MKIWAIAKIGFKECLRYRVVYFIFVMALVFIYMGKGCNPGTVKGEGILFDQDSLQQMAMTVAFHGIVFWSMLLCGLISANVLSRDVEEGTAAMTLSRPLSRSAFIAGKLLSILMVSCLNMFLLGTIFFTLFQSESGQLNLWLFGGFGIVVFSLMLFALINLFFSLFLPRLVTPLVGFIIYFMSFWNSIPYHFTKIRMVWEPSETVDMLHLLLPPLGDLQFIGAACISSAMTLETLAAPFCSLMLYCIVLWALLLFVFSRRPIS
ncbi:ABC transporter permease [Thermodesulfobacteriota bacterium]